MEKSKKVVREQTFNDEAIMNLDTISKASNSLVKISTYRKTGNGFFLKFKLDDGIFKALITSYKTFCQLSKDNNTNFEIKYDKDLPEKIISLSKKEKRAVYPLPEDDLCIIEILFTDYINDEFFLLLDQSTNNQKNYKDSNIFVIQQSPRQEPSFSPGVIKYISEDNNSDFGYTAGTYQNSAGSPVVIRSSMKVIGVHRGVGEEKGVGMNFGNFFKPIIDKLNIMRKSNEIDYRIYLEPELTGDELTLATKSAVKVKSGKGRFSCSGVFLKVQNGYDNFNRVLVTYYQTLSINRTKRIFKGKVAIELWYDNGFIKKTIEVDLDKEKRNYFFGNDLAIIKILPEYEIPDEYFIEIDPELFDYRNWRKESKNNIIYLMHFPEGNFRVFPGLISGINTGEGDFIHNCESTTIQSCGAPILSSSNFKLLGIHMGRNAKTHKAYGLFLPKILGCMKNIDFEE